MDAPAFPLRVIIDEQIPQSISDDLQPEQPTYGRGEPEHDLPDKAIGKGLFARITSRDRSAAWRPISLDFRAVIRSDLVVDVV